MDRAFERLYRRHAVDVYRYAFAVLRNQADAEDVTQTTFMNAYRALERGETPQTPHNWLIAIAHNVCRQRFRQASRRPLEVGLDEDVADQLVEPEDDTAPTPEDIRRGLQHLAFNQRAALVMREIEGRSYAEIAELLGVSVSAVETLIFRARRALREQLETGLTCGQAEQAISRQLDRAASRAERSQLRAHLRECAACRKIARSQRAQRAAFKALGAVPLPTTLASLFGGGGATVGVAVATKAAAVVIAAGVASGIGWDVHRRLVEPPRHRPAVAAHAAARDRAAPRPEAVAPTTVAQRPQAATHQRAHRVRHGLALGRRQNPVRPTAATHETGAAPAAHRGQGRAAAGQTTVKTHARGKSAAHARRGTNAHAGRARGHAAASTTPSTPHGFGRGHDGQADTAAQGGKGHGDAGPITLPVVPSLASAAVPAVPVPPVVRGVGDGGH